MHHGPDLIATIVFGLGLAFLLGTLAHRLRISPLIGYLLAGVAVGPFTPGFVADQGLSLQLAELGVILLMFGVGLHFSLKDLLSVGKIAVPGAVVQITIATLLGMGLAWGLGWGIGAGIVFGLALSVASTIVLLRALHERHELETERGRIAVGWLIVEDLAMVLILVLLPAVAPLLVASENAAALSLEEILFVMAVTIGKVVIFVAVMMLVGRRVLPWILHYIAHTGSRELFRLSVLALALVVAFVASELFGVSFALGAFFAGMVLSESPLSQRAAEESLPLRDAFAVLFFVSVGMLFNPYSLLTDFLPVLGTVFVIVIGKSIAAFAIVRAFGYSTSTALMISASLAQIGEFSFILAALGVTLGLLPEEGRTLILAGAMLSIILNPVAFSAGDWLKPYLSRKKPAAEDAAASAPEPAAAPLAEPALPPLPPLTGHTVLIGYGRVGSIVGEELKAKGLEFVVVEDSEKIGMALRTANIPVVSGNAVQIETLALAHVAEARTVIIAVSNVFEASQVVERSRAMNGALHIIAYSYSKDEADYLKRLGATEVIVGNREVARGLAQRALNNAASVTPQNASAPDPGPAPDPAPA